MISNFFIARPTFASVIAIVITLIGAIAIPLLPVAQFPTITPPTVQVSASYAGANSDVVESTIASPIEEQVNGVEGMLYFSSISSDGAMTMTVTFDIGYDLDIAAVDVLNRVQIAQPQLPDEVAREGIVVSKQQPFVTLCLNLLSPDDRYDDLFLSNYAAIHISDVLERLPGVGTVTLFGERTYAMRIWLDADKLASMGLTTGDVASAVEAQNQAVAAGIIGEPPVPSGQKFQYTLTMLGRLVEPGEFGDVIVRTRRDGSVVRVKDVARVELGAADYTSYVQLNKNNTINVCVFEAPGGNSLDIARDVRATMERLVERFPPGLEYTIIYDTTRFVRESIKEVLFTLLEAMVLVFLVMYVFLQDWRATLIPAITIPVSLVGTFGLLSALGFSINTLTLFGLVLAVGLVVDDAIVVVESVSRLLADQRVSRREAAMAAMGQVTGPIIATTLVLMAVFIPIAFMPGVTGQLYRQFALTIACAVGISAVNALTLSPALCAILLRPGTVRRSWFFRIFNRGFDRFGQAYQRSVKLSARYWYIVLVVFAFLLGATWYMIKLVPTGFVPPEDQGYFMVTMQGPEGAALERTRNTAQRIETILQDSPGIEHVLTFGGYSFVTSAAASNVATLFAILKPWSERTAADLHVEAIMAKVNAEFAAIPEAIIVAFNPPAIHGLGTTGGFQFELQDLTGHSPETLANLTHEMVRRGNEHPALTGLFSSFSADTPRQYVELDRAKALIEGVSIQDIFDTLQTQLGALYVNDFNKFGRVYQVWLQAEGEFRTKPEGIGRFYVRNQSGGMVPLSSFVALRPVVGPRALTHYNMYRSAEINGEAAPGYSSGQAIQVMEELAAQVLPDGFGYEWSGVAFQQLTAGNLAPIIFALSLVFVFLVLAAQYESWTMPLMIILAVPLAVLGALSAQWLRGLENDVYCQIGLVMLIGLASKNAILIVEFARRRREEGLTIEEAAMEAARIRLRPILMTAFAFVLGVLPLVLATGAGSASRHSLGTAVFGGMILATFLSLVLVPVLYILIERLRERTLRAGGERRAR